MVKRNAIYLVTGAVILSKQLKRKYELLLPAQIFFFFSQNINRFHQSVRRSHNPKASETH